MLIPQHFLGACPLLCLLAACATAQKAPYADTAVPFRSPVQVMAKDGTLDSPLYVVFGKTLIPGAPIKQKTKDGIDVRSYTLPQNQVKAALSAPMIPGPTFVFQPGDLLRLRFENHLNRSANPALNLLQNNPQESAPAAADDTDEHVSHEISIPNDSNVTNLHVHGLHVDPKQDNVTLLILPQDSDPSMFVPELQRFVPTINRWWTRNYQYKIPLDHLPGTYWYHAHKHGSTATQVENGMAGTLHMRPRNEADTLVPDLWNPDPAQSHDRIMVLQQIANFGVSQNKGLGGRKQPNLNSPVITINGSYESTLALAPSQIERWRFVVAGANHTTSTYLWVGSMVPTLSEATQAALRAIQTKEDSQKYIPGQNNTPPQLTFPDVTPLACSPMPGVVKLVAVDGIDIWQPRDITPSTPAMGSAGNRLDLLVQASDAAKGPAPQRIYKNYPVTDDDLIAAYPELFGSQAGQSGQYRLNALTQGFQTWVRNPTAETPLLPAIAIVDKASGNALPASNFGSDPYQLNTDYTGRQVWWANVDQDGNPLDYGKQPTAPNSVVPLLRGTEDGAGVMIDPDFAQNFPADPGWQPTMTNIGGAPVSGSILVNLPIDGVADGPQQFPADFDAVASSLSPAGTGSRLMKVDPSTRELVPGIPSYVSPITDADIKGRQVAVFDRGNFTFNYLDKASRTEIPFRQFWINGRQFSVDDWIGNPSAGDRIRTPLVSVEPSLGQYVPNAAETLWTHQFAEPEGPVSWITNPGYHRDVVALKVDDKTFHNYDYTSPGTPLSYKSVTGLSESNTPQSTTAEEWLLINNSDAFHPFHIHISPFFVTEIGQLNYDPEAQEGAPEWTLHKITYEQRSDTSVPFSWVVGNWWDVITLPPHGYVKMRTWINVPTQGPVNTQDPDSDLVVHDNTNVYGSWVMHCHILRHEDRGMMSLVNTQPMRTGLSGTWIAGEGGSTYSIVDNQGALTVTSADGDHFTGTFTGGVGNPIYSQPWLGAFSNTSGVETFCATSDGESLLVSDGRMWKKAGGSSVSKTVAAKDLNLSGTWIDGDGNRAQIKQPGGSSNPPFQLTFQPASPTWWSRGEGSWNPQSAASNSASPPTVYAGVQLLENIPGENQQLTFCVSNDLQTLVFGNGVMWTKE